MIVKNFSTNTEEIFNTKTKLLIAKMYDKSIIYKGKTITDGNDTLTGEPKLVEFRKVFNKLQQVLVGATTHAQMFERLENLQSLYPWIPAMIEQLKADEQVMNGFFKDFNRGFLYEEMILLNNDFKDKGNVIAQNRAGYIKLADRWLSGLRYKVLYDKLSIDSISDTYDRLQEVLSKSKQTLETDEQIELVDKPY